MLQTKISFLSFRLTELLPLPSNVQLQHRELEMPDPLYQSGYKDCWVREICLLKTSFQRTTCKHLLLATEFLFDLSEPLCIAVHVEIHLTPSGHLLPCKHLSSFETRIQFLSKGLVMKLMNKDQTQTNFSKEGITWISETLIKPKEERRLQPWGRQNTAVLQTQLNQEPCLCQPLLLPTRDRVLLSKVWLSPLVETWSPTTPNYFLIRGRTSTPLSACLSCSVLRRNLSEWLLLAFWWRWGVAWHVSPTEGNCYHCWERVRVSVLFLSSGCQPYLGKREFLCCVSVCEKTEAVVCF